MKLIKHFDLTAICGRKRPPTSERSMEKWSQYIMQPIDQPDHQRHLKFKEYESPKYCIKSRKRKL